MEEFNGQTAIVTGATSGIGRRTAVELASRGAYVIVAGRDPDRGGQTVAEITAAGGQASFVAADLGSPEGVETLISAARQRGHVDMLVNNAGHVQAGNTAALTSRDLQQTIAVNVVAAYGLARAFAPEMAARGRGAIVNVTSLAADRGVAFLGAYGASKAALAALTRAWAVEFGPAGVRVNAISPATVETEGSEPVRAFQEQNAALSPRGHTAPATDAAAVVAFLLGDGAAHIHGAIIPVDGGISAT